MSTIEPSQIPAAPVIADAAQDLAVKLAREVALAVEAEATRIGPEAAKLIRNGEVESKTALALLQLTITLLTDRLNAAGRAEMDSLLVRAKDEGTTTIATFADLSALTGYTRGGLIFAFGRRRPGRVNAKRRTPAADAADPQYREEARAWNSSGRRPQETPPAEVLEPSGFGERYDRLVAWESRPEN